MFGASLFTALAFGVAPAHFVHRLNLVGTLKSGGRGSTGDRGHRRFRHLLIVSQFALAMVLLAGAALFARGFHEINNRRHGWQSDQLVTGTLVLPDRAYPDDTRGPRRIMPQRELKENMVLCLECYAGKVGAPFGVKLEDQVRVTRNGPELICAYPYDSKLLG